MKKIRNFIKKLKDTISGFTLVELLAVIVILAIIMLIAIPGVLNAVTTARKKTFIEYVDKSVGLAQQKYLEGAITGQPSNSCYIYVIENDLGLNNTGDFKGFVMVAPSDGGGYQYWVLLYDNHYFLDAISYAEFQENNLSKLKVSPAKKSDLNINYFTDALQEKGVTCSSFDYSGGTVTPSDIKPGENEGTDCDGNKVTNTVPKSATGLYKLIAEKAYMDNVSSKYVSKCSGIDYKKVSDDSVEYYGPGMDDYNTIHNGTGVYEMSSTKNDKYPIYYYRGNMSTYASADGNANNVVFGGSCWKIIRTTSTGGVKMIYNGAYSSGSCGTSNLGYLEYNANSNNSLGDASYMYGKKYVYASKSQKNLKAVFADTVNYSNGKYILAGDKITYSTSTVSSLNDVVGKQYTCFNESGECTNVYYIYKNYANAFYYITLSGGETITDALRNSFEVNAVDSSAKKTVDNWFANNLVSYQSYLEDTPYCNDRTIYSYGAFDEKYSLFKGKTDIINMSFAGYERGTKTGKVSLQCNKNDAFTVSASNGNGALKYPVGLITYDEAVLAGGSTGWEESGGYAESAYNSKFYLHDSSGTWTMTPSYYGVACSVFSGCYNDVHSQPYTIDSAGYIIENYYKGLIKPVISLKAGVEATGTGTNADPYVIK